MGQDGDQTGGHRDLAQVSQNGRPPAVSIAIRAYRRRWLAEAIESVLAQTYQDLELVVYDDAGDLEPVVAEFAGDPRVRYARAERVLAESGRFSAAAALCRGRYIGMLDDDDRYEPEFVAKLAAALEHDPRSGVAFCRNRWSVDGALYLGDMNALRPGRQPDALRDALTSRLTPTPSRMLMRRDALEDAERRQPMPDGVAPDIFVNVTTSVAGWAHVLVDEVLVTSRWHKNQTSRGRNWLGVSIATWRVLRVDDPELDALRERRHAVRLIDRAVAALLDGEGRAARADLREAARIDAGASVRRRRAAAAIATLPGAARAVAGARSVKRRFHRRDDFPPRVGPAVDGPGAVPAGRPARQVARDAARFAAGSGAAQALTVLAAPVLTRLFTPAQVGAAGVLSGTMLAFAPVACLRFDLAIPLARTTREAAKLCAVCLVAGAAVTAILGILAALFGAPLCEAANVPQMSAYTWLVPLQAAVAAPGLVGLGLLVRWRRYSALAGGRLAQSAAQVGTQVTAGAAGVGAPAAWFAGAATVGAAASTLTLVTRARRGLGALRPRVGEAFRGARSTARKWRRFAGWSSGGVVMLGGSLAVPAILVAALYGPAAAGLFVVAQRVIGLPAMFAAEAVGTAWSGTAAEIVREDRGRLREPLKAITRTMLVGGGAVMVVVLLLGPTLFGSIFGADWHHAGHLLLALAPLHFSVFAAAPAGQTLVALRRTDLVTLVSAGRLASPIIGVAGGHALGLSLTGALGLYAACMVAVSVMNATFAWRLSGRTPRDRS